MCRKEGFFLFFWLVEHLLFICFRLGLYLIFFRIHLSYIKLVGLLSIVQTSINVYKKSYSFIMDLYIILYS